MSLLMALKRPSVVTEMPPAVFMVTKIFASNAVE